MSDLGWFDANCRDCERLSGFLDQVVQRYPNYHARPVAPFGDKNARLLIVGLAPGMHGANATGRPFTGDHAGIILYDTLHRFGFSNKPLSKHRNDGLALLGCRITNAVKCLPPQNKPAADEINNCNRFLCAELRSLQERGVILALGAIAHAAVLKAFRVKLKDAPFGHGAEHRLPEHNVLLDSYHCSRYNTQTRRLTPKMFDAVFERVRELLETI